MCSSDLEPDSPLVVTAVLPRDATAQDFVLAAGQPSDLSKGQATGNQHRIYRVVQQLFDGSDPLLVDVERNELVLGNAEGETIIDYAPGQSVQYSVLPDQESAKDSYPIEGLTGGTDYYLIPRGGTRYALAASQEDALAGLALDLTGLGTGSFHLLSLEEGQTIQVQAELLPLQDDDIQAPGDAQAQVNHLLLDGTFETGDVIKISLLNEGDRSNSTSDLSFTVATPERSAIRDGLIQLINSSVGSGDGAYVLAAPTATGDPGIVAISALVAGQPFLLIAGALNGSGADNTDTTQGISVEVIQDNVTPANQLDLNVTFVEPPSSLPPQTTVQISQGLLQAASQQLIGASAFLTSTDQLIDSTGSPVDESGVLSLRPGDVVYVETAAAGPTSGAYLRFQGSGDWQGTASQLRTSINTATDSWLVDAGPLLQLVRSDTSGQSFRLQGSTQASAPSLLQARIPSSSGAALMLNLPTPAALFDPATAVDDVNNILTLPGFAASTGHSISYGTDPNFSQAIEIGRAHV